MAIQQTWRRESGISHERSRCAELIRLVKSIIAPSSNYPGGYTPDLSYLHTSYTKCSSDAPVVHSGVEQFQNLPYAFFQRL